MRRTPYLIVIGDNEVENNEYQLEQGQVSRCHES